MYCFGNINSVVVLSHAKKVIEILIERDRVSEAKMKQRTKTETRDLNVALNEITFCLLLR